MTPQPAPARWDIYAAAACAVLSFVPFARVPAGAALLCLLPGAAIARRFLGPLDPVGLFALGGLFSVIAVPAVAIPVALVVGRPTHAAAVAVAAAIVLLAALWPGRGRSADGSPPQPGRSRALVAILVAALAMQAGLSLAKLPEPDTVRWRGLPDLFFFEGIYEQIVQHMPPMDPERGDALLVHNWIYHFHYALVHLVTGLPIPWMMRLVSAWLACVLLGLVWLVASRTLRSPPAAVLACLFVMTSGELYWLERSLLDRTFSTASLRWEHSPFGVTLLFGWYNLAPLCAGLGAWLLFARHRDTGRPGPLAASIALCAAMAFFHPVFYGVFMIGFCLWLIRLRLREPLPSACLLYLATPVPFFLLYKLPYFGMAMPPPVVHFDPDIARVLSRGLDLLQWGGALLPAAVTGLVILRAAAGPLPWILFSSILLHLFVSAPNPHWFKDLMYLSLALAAGSGLAWLIQRSRRAGLAAASAVLTVGGVAFCLQLSEALRMQHTFRTAEKAAGEWLRSRTGPDETVAILPNSISAYTILRQGHRRLVHGWTNHQLDFHHDALQHARDVAEIYGTADPDRAAALAGRLGVDYLLVGSYERDSSPRTGLTDACFPVMLAQDGLELRRFACGAGPPD